MRTLIVLALVVVACGSAAGQSETLLANPGFERLAAPSDAAERGPTGWRIQTWGGRADFAGAAGREGTRGVEVRSSDGADAGWWQVVRVKPFSRYRLAGWARTEKVERLDGNGVVLNLHARPEHTEPLLGTTDWTRVSLEFETAREDAVQVNCCFGYHGRVKGRAWFDDLSLELLETRVPRAAVTIDAATEGAPISPYIYSQFIEHLGRCIQGGIWAEMIEDRKFFLLVGGVGAVPENESPWIIVGPSTCATMERAAPLVGEHSPKIALRPGIERGLQQTELGVRAGVPCIGRIWLAGDASAAPVTLTLIWGENPEDRHAFTVSELSPEFVMTEFGFAPSATSEAATFRVTSRGAGSFRVGAVSLMPADNIRGMRADTLALLRELDAPLYRWPGGNFVSGYDWRDGLGDSDRRPPRKNPAWRGVESNDFGIHEFLNFCAELATEPLVVTNAGFGDAHSAAQEVEYINGAAGTAMSAWRAQNGRAEPWGVKWWGIGNEMYGPWQLGHMALEQYVLKHNDFARAMRAVDPSISLVGVGADGPWSEGMLTHCAAAMDVLSEHFYCQERPGVLGHVEQVPAAIRAKVAAHRRYRTNLPALEGRDIRIAMDEWNYWYGPEVYGELGTRYTVKDGLGIGAGLHEYFRSSDIVFMANYAQTVNVIGAIKTTGTAAAMDTTGHVLAMYRKHFGDIPVMVRGESGVLDVAAALTADRRALTVGVVNATGDEQPLEIVLVGVAAEGSAEGWRIASDDPEAFNEPGKADRVKVVPVSPGRVVPGITVPPYSVSIFRQPCRAEK